MQQAETDTIGRRILGEVALAEIYLLEATLESAMVLNKGVQRAQRSLLSSGVGGRESIGMVFRSTRADAVDSFRSRFRHLAEVVREDWSDD